MIESELHVQACLWDHHRTRFAVLFLEGEAPDRSNGGAMMPDALLRVVLARGLRLTTDLDHLILTPTPGWHARIDRTGLVTVEWPHVRPLLADAPLALPGGWSRAAMEHGIVLVFAGFGLGLHEQAGDGQAHPLERLARVAEDGALASGAVPFLARALQPAGAPNQGGGQQE